MLHSVDTLYTVHRSNMPVHRLTAALNHQRRASTFRGSLRRKHGSMDILPNESASAGICRRSHVRSLFLHDVKSKTKDSCDEFPAESSLKVFEGRNSNGGHLVFGASRDEPLRLKSRFLLRRQHIGSHYFLHLARKPFFTSYLGRGYHRKLVLMLLNMLRTL